MKKVFVLSQDKTFERGVMEALPISEYNVSTPLVEPQGLYSYMLQFHPDVIIIHNSYIRGFYRLFDMLLQSKRCYVIYGSALLEEGALYNALSSSRFFMMDDRSYLGIPMVLRIMERDTQLIEAIASENDKLKAKVLESGLVKKAKTYLMEHKNMNEEEAYKYILKLSMDSRSSKADIAKNILNGVVK